MDFAALDAAVMGGFAERELALYTPANQASFDLRGIFDRHMVEVESPVAGDGPPTMAPRTAFSVSAADLPPGFVPRARDRLLIRGVTYDVKDVPAADALGWIVLGLGRIG
jgi:hypothetical protein